MEKKAFRYREPSKAIKQRARAVTRKHWLVMVALCLAAALLHVEYSDTIDRMQSAVSNADFQNISIDTVASLYTAPVSGAVEDTSGNAFTVLLICASDGLEAGSRLAEDIREREIENADKGIANRRRGILAGLINFVSSGQIWVSLLAGARNILHSDNVATGIMIFVALLIYIGLWMLIRQTAAAILRRFFLEYRIYDKVPFTRMLLFQRVRRWGKAALTMAVTAVFQMLWGLTIIGGIIKYCSYFCVPYIVAENPDIGPLEAVRLSRRMMNGNKWDLFVKKLSFILWDLLDVLTFGLAGILWYNPYRMAALTEYYAALRAGAIAAGVEGTDKLNDTYLFEKADEALLQKTYADVIREESIPPRQEKPLPGFRGFLQNWFGITIGRYETEEAYEYNRSREICMREDRLILKGEAYPSRLYPIPEAARDKELREVSYMRSYRVWSLCWIFITFAFIGWIWEVSLHAVTTGQLVNRGNMHGPWLPIYGAGGVLGLIFLKKLRNRPIPHLIGTVLLCGLVEYFTGYFMEISSGGKKWWDYSGHFLNLHGRVCAEGLLLFGLAGTVAVYLVAPMVDKYLQKRPRKPVIILITVIMCIFFADRVYSNIHPNQGKGITDIGVDEVDEIEETVEPAAAAVPAGEYLLVRTEEIQKCTGLR